MSMDVRVVGVGMVPFAKPGASESYVEMGSKAVRAALTDAGLPYSADPAGLCRLRLRRLDLRAGGALPRRHDRHSDRQRQQQLLDRLDRAVSGAAGGRSRRGRCALARRLRGNAPRRTRLEFSRSRRPDDSPRRDDGRSAGDRSEGAARRAVFRRRRAPSMRESTAPRDETFAKIAQKARKHAANNPYAMFRTHLSVEEILGFAQSSTAR